MVTADGLPHNQAMLWTGLCLTVLQYDLIGDLLRGLVERGHISICRSSKSVRSPSMAIPAGHGPDPVAMLSCDRAMCHLAAVRSMSMWPVKHLQPRPRVNWSINISRIVGVTRSSKRPRPLTTTVMGLE